MQVFRYASRWNSNLKRNYRVQRVFYAKPKAFASRYVWRVDDFVAGATHDHENPEDCRTAYAVETARCRRGLKTCGLRPPSPRRFHLRWRQPSGTRKPSSRFTKKHENLRLQLTHCSTSAFGYREKLTSSPILLPVPGGDSY